MNISRLHSLERRLEGCIGDGWSLPWTSGQVVAEIDRGRVLYLLPYCWIRPQLVAGM